MLVFPTPIIPTRAIGFDFLSGKEAGMGVIGAVYTQPRPIGQNGEETFLKRAVGRLWAEQ